MGLSSSSRGDGVRAPLWETALLDFGAPVCDPEQIFALALAHGGDLAELFYEESNFTRLIFEDQKVDSVLRGVDAGIGLRILSHRGHQSTYGYTTDRSLEALERLACTLREGVTRTQSPLPRMDRPEWRWAQAKQGAAHRIQKDPDAMSLVDQVTLLRRADQAARAVASEITQVTVALIMSRRKILILNSDGLLARDQKLLLQFFVQVVGHKAGRMETAYETQGGHLGLELFDEHSPESIAQKAARRLQILLDGVAAPAGSMPVVISAQAGGTMIHEAVGHGLEADLACNGLSVYQGKLGQPVASPLITVIDDGTLPNKRGSFTFDDEGNAARRTTLIESGTLQNYLVDRICALKFDLMVTGNGRRESFRHAPMVRMTNTYIAPGPHDPESILRDTPRGIFVQAMGGGQVDTVSGDFVFAVTEGYLIQDGKLGAPIRGATLVGNGPEVLRTVDRVGSDLGFTTGTCGKDGQSAPVTDAQPTLRVPALTVGGEVPQSHYWSSP